MSTARDRIATRTFIVVLCALASALAGCAASPPQAESNAPTIADADPLLAAALRAWAVDNDPAQALRLAERATDAAPKRADAAWLHLRLCDAAPRCETAPLEARLKRIAPHNGAVWLSVLKRAQAQKDRAAEAEILGAMSRAREFNLYWTTLVHRLATALHASTPPRTGEAANAPLTAALTETVQWLSALDLPSFAPLTTACSGERLRDSEHRAVCERIAQVLQRGDSYAAEGLGLGIVQRLAMPGTATAQEVEQRIATLAYQNQTAASITAGQVERERFAAEMLELMKKLPREQDVSLAILRWAGEPLTP